MRGSLLIGMLQGYIGGVCTIFAAKLTVSCTLLRFLPGLAPSPILDCSCPLMGPKCPLKVSQFFLKPFFPVSRPQNKGRPPNSGPKRTS